MGSPVTDIMMIKFLLLSLLGLLPVSRAEISSDGLMFAERMAFVLCDSDKMFGLTWREVERCEERFADMLTEEDIPVPSKVDFDAADLDGDGTLTMEEWKVDLLDWDKVINNFRNIYRLS